MYKRFKHYTFKILIYQILIFLKFEDFLASSKYWDRMRVLCTQSETQIQLTCMQSKLVCFQFRICNMYHIIKFSRPHIIFTELCPTLMVKYLAIFLKEKLFYNYSTSVYVCLSYCFSVSLLWILSSLLCY